MRPTERAWRRAPGVAAARAGVPVAEVAAGVDEARDVPLEPDPQPASTTHAAARGNESRTRSRLASDHELSLNAA
jgi:hypothetical protein